MHKVGKRDRLGQAMKENSLGLHGEEAATADGYEQNADAVDEAFFSKTADEAAQVSKVLVGTDAGHNHGRRGAAHGSSNRHGRGWKRGYKQVHHQWEIKLKGERVENFHGQAEASNPQAVLALDPRHDIGGRLQRKYHHEELLLRPWIALQ